MKIKGWEDAIFWLPMPPSPPLPTIKKFSAATESYLPAPALDWILEVLPLA
jgi:hypothetical protein